MALLLLPPRLSVDDWDWNYEWMNGIILTEHLVWAGLVDDNGQRPKVGIVIRSRIGIGIVLTKNMVGIG